MSDWLLWALLALAVFNGLAWMLSLALASRSRADTATPQLLAAFAGLSAASERMERELRTEVQSSARDGRTEFTQALSLFQQALL